MTTRTSSDGILTAPVLPRDIHALLAEARRNEITLRKFQKLELCLLDCRSLVELMQILLYDSRAAFAWDAVTLTLIDPEHELRQLLEHTKLAEHCCADVIFVTDSSLLPEEYRALRLPSLNTWERVHAPLFPAGAHALTSVAILPLIRSEAMTGSLNIGSRDPVRFRPGTGTDFLAHLAAIIASCLETVVVQECLRRAGLTDALTGINNRRFFDQRLPEEIARARRLKLPLSLLLIDIDHFKAINDTYGHPGGDRILQAVATRIRHQLRATDVAARFGGEEFAVVLAGAGDIAAIEVAERIRKCVAAQVFPLEDGKTLAAAISVGVASLDAKPESHQQTLAAASARLIEAADRALYEAKRTGRNRVVHAPSPV